MKTKNIGKKIINTVGISALCLASALAGRLTSNVDKVTFHEETWPGGLSSFKAIRLHKPCAPDQIFIKRNGYFHWEAKDCLGTYQPMKEDLTKRYISSFAEEREEDIKKLVYKK